MKFKIFLTLVIMLIAVVFPTAAMAIQVNLENPFDGDFVMAVNTNTQAKAEYTGLNITKKIDTSFKLFDFEKQTEKDFFDDGIEDNDAVLMADTQYSLGDTKEIYSSQNRQKEKFQLVKIGEKYTLWVESDTEYTGDYDFVGTTFDDKIYKQLTDVFGDWYDVDGDGKLAIFIYKITGTTKGYMSSYDIYNNKIDCIHLNYNYISTAKTTLAHEFTHLLSFSQKMGFADTWIEEGIATVAENIYSGQISLDLYNDYSDYFDDGLSFLNWSTSINYPQVNVFMHYLNEQMKLAGEKNYTGIAKLAKCGEYTDYRVIESVMQEYYPDITMQQILLNYNIALAAKQSAGKYGFGGNKVFDDLNIGLFSGNGTYSSVGDNMLLGGAYSIIPTECIDKTNIDERGSDIRFVGLKLGTKTRMKNGCEYSFYYLVEDVFSSEISPKIKVIIASYDENEMLYDIQIEEYKNLTGDSLQYGKYQSTIMINKYLVFENEDNPYMPPEDDEWWQSPQDKDSPYIEIRNGVVNAVHGGKIKTFIVKENGITPIDEAGCVEVE